MFHVQGEPLRSGGLGGVRRWRHPFEGQGVSFSLESASGAFGLVFWLVCSFV